MRSMESLFIIDKPWTYTRCQESVERSRGRYPTVIGGFGSAGLGIVRQQLLGRDRYCVGVGGGWKL